MDKAALQDILTKKRVPVTAYSLDGKLYPDRFEIRYIDNKWQVYYCDERGVKHGLKIFGNEEDACDYFYDFMSSNSYMSTFFR